MKSNRMATNEMKPNDSISHVIKIHDAAVIVDGIKLDSNNANTTNPKNVAFSNDKEPINLTKKIKYGLHVKNGIYDYECLLDNDAKDSFSNGVPSPSLDEQTKLLNNDKTTSSLDNSLLSTSLTSTLSPLPSLAPSFATATTTSAISSLGSTFTEKNLANNLDLNCQLNQLNSHDSDRNNSENDADSDSKLNKASDPEDDDKSKEFSDECCSSSNNTPRDLVNSPTLGLITSHKSNKKKLVKHRDTSLPPKLNRRKSEEFPDEINRNTDKQQRKQKRTASTSSLSSSSDKNYRKFLNYFKLSSPTYRAIPLTARLANYSKFTDCKLAKSLDMEMDSETYAYDQNGNDDHMVRSLENNGNLLFNSLDISSNSQVKPSQGPDVLETDKQVESINDYEDKSINAKKSNDGPKPSRSRSPLVFVKKTFLIHRASSAPTSANDLANARAPQAFKDEENSKSQRLKNENFYLKNVLHNLNQKQKQKNPFESEKTLKSSSDTNVLQSIDDPKNQDAKNYIEYQNKKILNLQEELIRVKVMLDECQYRRKNDLEKMHKLQQRIREYEQNIKQPRNQVQSHVQLINKISKLQASENLLREFLDNERIKNQTLSEQMKMAQKMYETERRPSLQSPSLSGLQDPNRSLLSPTEAIESPPPVPQRATSQKIQEISDDGGLFDDVANEVLREHGIDISGVKDRNYKDALILIYEDKLTTQKKLNELQFYLSQVPTNSSDRNPVTLIKKLCADLKTKESEIEELNDEIMRLKLDIEDQAEKSRNQVIAIQDENKNLKSEVESLISEIKKQNFQATLSQYESRAASAEVHPTYKSSAKYTTTKFITISAPNEELSELTVTSTPGPMNIDSRIDSPIIMTEYRHQAVSPISSPTFERSEFASKIESLENCKNNLESSLEKAKAKINELEYERKSLAESDLKKSQAIREYSEELETMKLERIDLQTQVNKSQFEFEKLLARNSLNEKLEEKNVKIIDDLTKEYEKLVNEKLTLEGRLETLFKENAALEEQLTSIHTQLKSYQNDNALLAKKYEQQIHMLEDQIQSYKAENAKIRSENNELTLAQTKNNTELTDYIKKYEADRSNWNKQLTIQRVEFENLKLENEKLEVKLSSCTNEMNKLTACFEDKFNSYDSEITNLRSHLTKTKMECDNYKEVYERTWNENEDLKQTQARINDEQLKKIELYELEIINLNKEITKTRIDMQNSQLDLGLKRDEVERLQKTINDLSQMRDKYFEVDQQLNIQLKNNQIMQEKLAQLQNDLIAKGLTSHEASLVFSNEISADKIIENLKIMIQEQLSQRNASTENDIEELKFKIHDLQMKLTREKLQNESLEIKYKLVDQDNQNLRKTLLSSNRKYNSSDKMSKSRMDEINEIIEKAQKNAQSIMSSAPKVTSIYD